MRATEKTSPDNGAESPVVGQQPSQRAGGEGERPTPASSTAHIAVALAVEGARFGLASVRIALVPVRLAARMPVVGGALRATAKRLEVEGRTAVETSGDHIDAAASRVAAAPEVTRTIDGLLGSSFVESVARSAVEHGVVERAAAPILQSSRLEDALLRALEDERTRRLVERGLASPAVERMVIDAVESRLTADVLEHVLRSPEVRAALARESMSFADEILAAVRRRVHQADDGVSGRIHRWLRLGRRQARDQIDAPSTYGGLVARATAFVVDLVLVGLTVGLAAGLLALVTWLVGDLRPTWLVGAILGSASTVAFSSYFVFFWTSTGQTPGMRTMGVRVADGHGQPPGVARSLVRLVALVAAIVLLFLGLLPMLFDDRRRGLHDMLAGTLVALDPPPDGSHASEA